MQIELYRNEWEFSSPFRISYGTRTRTQTAVVQLRDGEHVGRGEASGVAYRGETAESLLQELHLARENLPKGVTRFELQHLLPPGGARNAIDCALWDLEAKRRSCRAWEIAGLQSVRTLRTAFTLSLDAPEAMGKAAAAAKSYSLLKLKLCGTDDIERVTVIRRARPDAELIVDANQGWDERQLKDFTPRFAALGVKLIEQPLPAGKDDALAGFATPVPFCADESCQTTESLPELLGKYQYVNIKLDKAGGLTEALRVVQAAQRMRFGLIVGCMAGSSLATAPGFIVGQFCDVVDLDAPLLLNSDVPHAIRYEGSAMHAPEACLWG
jgi:L-Ala-D/L-Glu epimerase